MGVPPATSASDQPVARSAGPRWNWLSPVATRMATFPSLLPDVLTRTSWPCVAGAFWYTVTASGLDCIVAPTAVLQLRR